MMDFLVEVSADCGRAEIVTESEIGIGIYKEIALYVKHTEVCIV
jgi:hypothetical protein